MSGHTYKLKYFPLKARGEPIRYLFAYADVPYEDVRLPTEQWPTLKPTMPFGKVPVLEIDGKVTHQSRAICRYLGKKFGLGGADDWENLQIDMAVDTFEDMRDNVRNYYRDEVPESKKAKYEPLIKETLPFYLGRLEDHVKSQGGYMANGKVRGCPHKRLKIFGMKYGGKHFSSIRTTMLIHERLKRQESNLMHFKWEVT